MVSRGTRYQRYCWYCQVFWKNRLAAIEPAISHTQTRIPDYPDQSDFLDRWHDFHRGYRLVRQQPSGVESRIPLTLQKPWSDVDPGHLPVLDAREATTRVAGTRRSDSPSVGVSIDAALDELLQEASSAPPAGVSRDSLPPPAPQAGSGPTQAATEESSRFDPQQAEVALTWLNETSVSLQQAEERRARLRQELLEADREVQACQASRNRAVRNHRAAARRLVRLMGPQDQSNQAAAAQRLARVFGTREEIEQQGTDYVSPLASMFTRAYERYRVAEEVRAEDRASQEQADRHDRIVEGLQRRYDGLVAVESGLQRSSDAIDVQSTPRNLDDEAQQRPPPKSDAEMTVKLVCKVCLQQSADTALLPCGHLYPAGHIIISRLRVPHRPRATSLLSRATRLWVALALSTTSSSKKRKLTYTRNPRQSTWDKQQHSIFADDQPDSLTSPRSSPHPASPPAAQGSSPPTPRYIPPHLHDEVFESSVALRSPQRDPQPSAGQLPRQQPSAQESSDSPMPDADRLDTPAGNENSSDPRPSHSNTSSVSLTEAGFRSLAVGARASSPAKRTAAEFEEGNMRENEHEDVPGNDPTDGQRSPKKPMQQHVSPMPSRFRRVSADDLMQEVPSATDGSSSENSTSRETPRQAGGSTPATSLDGDHESPAVDLPSYDEQEKQVMDLLSKVETREGIKGFAISIKWLMRVRSRTSQGLLEGYPKEAREGKVGPIDNSDIVLNDHSYNNLKDSAGDLFIPLRPGSQMSTDFEIMTPEAWQLIVGWYGVAEPSHVVTRYMHNTAPPDAAVPNFQYELFPPIVTVQKMRGSSAPLSQQAMEESQQPAANLVASRSDKYQSFLKRVKTSVGIDLGTKVRVWRVLDAAEAKDVRSGMPTPDSSRGASPAPQASLPRVQPKLLVDMNTFTSLAEGSQRELIDMKDETANEKYNGSTTLDTIGFPETQTLVLEEQSRDAGKEEFVSDSLSKTAAQHGISLSPVRKSASALTEVAKAKSTINIARRSPTPTGALTRGRTAKARRTRGCTGLTNLGNTCYMNSALQCVRSIEELTLYFLANKWNEEVNGNNPLGYGGAIAKAYYNLLKQIYDPDSGGSFAPRGFKAVLGRHQPMFSGYGQQDSQEFLSFLVDGLHEDLNRILKKPYNENPESDDKTVNDPQAIRELGEKFRTLYRARNESVAMDLFNGFYKNTMVCPVCEKVSITFDPYSLLTLQLPVDQTWQHAVVFAPLRGRPVSVEVDISKSSNVKMIKDYVTTRIPGGADPSKCVMAEMYSDKFYKVFEDSEIVAETVQPQDKLVLYELDDSPTNWPPQGKKKTSKFNFSFGFGSSNTDSEPLDQESPAADRIAVPLVHRMTIGGRVKFCLWPSFILITRDEALDFDSILRKVLQKIQTMTTRPMFEDEENTQSETTPPEGSDSLVMDEDESSVEDSKIQAKSVEGEDDVVDITMNNSRDTQVSETEGSRVTPQASEPKSKILDPSFFISPELRNMFTLLYYGASSNDIIPTGFSTLSEKDRLQTLDSRARRPGSRRQSGSSWRSRSFDRNSPMSSEDELSKHEQSHDEGYQSPLAESEDESPPPSANLRPESAKGRSRFSRFKKPGSLRPHFRGKRIGASRARTEDYLIRLGEGIVVDWDETGYDQLFGGDTENDFRGRQTGSDVPTIPDPELDTKKQRRAARKKNGVTLQECFIESAKSEILSEENAWYCTRCKELRRASKTLEIWTVPDILVVHLKRFSSTSRLRDKMDVLVDFPVEGLDLAGRVGLPEDKGLVYDLFAVDNHFGGLGGGHYTAYAKNFFDKKWYEYNDTMVSGASPQSVVTKSAYLLFYRRRSDKPLGPPYLQDLVTNFYAEAESSEETQDEAASDAEAEPKGPIQLGPPPQMQFNDQPPAYDSRGYDEGISMDDPDDPLPSHEDGPVMGPELPPFSSAPTWSFDSLGEHGIHAPPASNNGDSDTLDGVASDAPDVGEESLDDRLISDFGDDHFHDMERGVSPERDVVETEMEDMTGVQQIEHIDPRMSPSHDDSRVHEVRLDDDEVRD